MSTPASISLRSLQHQSRLPSDLSSPAGASTWGGIYIPGILCAFGGPLQEPRGWGGGGSRRRAGPLATSAAPVGNERPPPTFLHEEAQCCMNLQVLALPHGERRWYSSKFPHLSSGCTHCNRLIKPVERLKRLEGPLACGRPQC